MSVVKPLALQWCIESWQRLSADKTFVAQGWYRSCTSLYDVNDPEKRRQALAAVARGELDAHAVPEGAEPDPGESAASDSESDSESDHESNDEEDELDTSQIVREGTRRSTRAKTPVRRSGYMLNSQQIAMTEDSEA